MNQDQKFDYQNGNHSKSKKNKTKHNRNSNNSTSTSTTTTTTNSNSNNHNNNGFSSNIPSTFNIDNIVNNGNVNNIVNTNLGSNINTNNSFNINTNTNNNNHNNNTNISINKLVNIINTDIDTKTTMNKKNNIDNLLFKKDYNNNEMNDSFSINPNNNNNNTICNSKNNNNNDIKKSNFKPSLINDDYDKDPFLNITDNKQVYYEIIKRISYDNNFFNRKYNFLKIKCKDNITMTVFDMYQLVMLSLDDFPKKKNWTKFSLITSAQRICLNREYVMHIIKNPNKIKKYPIAKSVAIASKTADDCTIGLLLLMEASRENNNHPVRFSYCKSWVFYQCCIVYIIRYVATQESKYIKFYSKESLKYSNFSSFPQETLAPCYFYLNLLKQMRSYFPQVQNIIYEIKLLINQAIKAIREKTFDIVINEILFNNV
ncbi:hypothetical protein BCR36DRAFT_286915 [Piromyces finnis]|uniref:Uncharacterized protein n=1 Tax=Piromyces finnis TaxID=1754191 RepID=A0A1Y1VCW6_9FUNG|nr:hypothetical protein BCR36DRAFT_286915 [Piromyces finnis]|eukprot:ORX52175.1 hypothetical protein BCR36DRAFT_286915 [Piromyces finnis]